jgi:hypothetical protein
MSVLPLLFNLPYCSHFTKEIYNPTACVVQEEGHKWYFLSLKGKKDMYCMRGV